MAACGVFLAFLIIAVKVGSYEILLVVLADHWFYGTLSLGIFIFLMTLYGCYIIDHSDRPNATPVTCCCFKSYKVHRYVWALGLLLLLA